MKTDEDIIDDVLQHIKASGVMDSMKGKVYDTERETVAPEDVVVNMEYNRKGEVQEAYVSVDVFVPSIKVDDQWRRPRKRLRQLCRLWSDCLQLGGLNKDFRLTLDSQNVEREKDTREFKIYNRLLYQTLND